MRFDWYGGNVRLPPDVILAGLDGALRGTAVRADREFMTRHYAFREQFRDPEGSSLCEVLHGGQNGAYGSYVRSTGWAAAGMVPVLRKLFPQQSISRADVAIDFDGPGCWEKLHGVALAIARAFGVKWHTVGDFREDRDPLAGRTIYLGSRQSMVFVRIYEKGKKELLSVRVGEPLPSLDWVRVEIEVKPPNQRARSWAAGWSEEQFWGCSSWSRKLLLDITGTGVERIMMTVRKETEARRSIRHMAAQYRGAMEAVLSEEGQDGLWKLIEEVWGEQDRLARLRVA